MVLGGIGLLLGMNLGVRSTGPQERACDLRDGSWVLTEAFSPRFGEVKAYHLVVVRQRAMVHHALLLFSSSTREQTRVTTKMLPLAFWQADKVTGTSTLAQVNKCTYTCTYHCTYVSWYVYVYVLEYVLEYTYHGK